MLVVKLFEFGSRSLAEAVRHTKYAMQLSVHMTPARVNSLVRIDVIEKA
jgi:hypothetical protein